MACKRCKRDHEPVSYAEWLWQLRDYKPKPPGNGGFILVMLMSRLDPATGCGWVTVEQTGTDSDGKSDDTVRRALDWGQQHGLINRAMRGHRLGDGTARASEWQLVITSQPRTGAGLSQSQPRTGAGKSTPQPRKTPASTPQNGVLNPALVRGQERPTQERPITSSLSALGSAFDQAQALVPELTREIFDDLLGAITDSGGLNADSILRSKVKDGADALHAEITHHLGAHALDPPCPSCGNRYLTHNGLCEIFTLPASQEGPP